MLDNRQLQFSSGIEVAIAGRHHERRLSVNSCVGILSLQTVRKPITKWPLVEGRDGAIREISLTEQCLILGSKRWRNAVLVTEKEAVDTAWMSTPSKVRAEIIGGICGGFRFPSHDQSVEEGDIDSDYHGCAATGDEIPAEAYLLYQYWPEVIGDDQYGANTMGRRTSADDAFRVGKKSRAKISSTTQFRRMCDGKTSRTYSTVRTPTVY